MKKAIRSYITFTRSGRIGMIILIAALIILLLFRMAMSLWAPVGTDKANEYKLVAAWEKFKRSQPEHMDSPFQERQDFVDAADKNPVPMQDIVDLNTVDSATLVRFKGIGPVTAGRIINYRKLHGPYSNLAELLQVCSISKATAELLKKHLVIYAAQ